MQSVSGLFTNISQAKLRKLNWSLYIAWDNTFNSSINFFTIGTSWIGGNFIIKGDGNTVQEWDRYVYSNYTSRVIDFSYTREQDPYIGGAILSIADITLDNSDNLFTPNYPTSSLSNNILPWRPVRIYMGMGNEVIPVFIGLLENMPEVDDKAKTVRLHCIDFMQSLFNYTLDEVIMVTNQTTDQVISTLLQQAGLLTSQMNLDVGEQVIPFFFADKGEKIGDYIRLLAQAEMGKIYMDETGMIRFLNRSNWLANSTLNWTFNRANTIERKTPTDENIINVVEIKSDIIEVLDNQKIWQLATPTVVPANSTVDIWADLPDPVTSVDQPEYITSATTSFYETNLASDGSQATNNNAISVQLMTAFAKSVKLTFSNSSSQNTYLTNIELFGTPARVTRRIYDRETDATSVTNYHERPINIQNKFIQDQATAESIASMLIQDNKDYNPIRELIVVGVPQLQVGDLVRVVDEKNGDIYTVAKIESKFIGASFTQVLTVVKKTINKYFRIGVTSVGSNSELIAP